jgi:transcriptional regulator with PAS, ATPase and Fis domain
VDVRVIAATNKKLHEAVAAGKFREDLYYRLHVIPIMIPPLRERAEDIPLLTESFLGHFSTKHGQPRKHLSAEALRRFQRFSWPGNVRQLRNIVERMVVICPREMIGVEDLPDELRLAEVPAPSFALRPGMTLAEAEKMLIAQTLRHVTSNREKAAKLLGISRRTLQYKLKHYGLLDQGS